MAQLFDFAGTRCSNVFFFRLSYFLIILQRLVMFFGNYDNLYSHLLCRSL